MSYSRFSIVKPLNGITRSKSNAKTPKTKKGRIWWVTQFPSKLATVYAKSDPTTGWHLDVVRTGLVAKKLGMSMDWDEWGHLRPLTFLQIPENHVVEVKTEEKHGYTALKIGVDNLKLKYMNKATMGICAHAGVPPKHHFVEFKVTTDAIIPVGTQLTCMHFQPGQKVDIQGISKGKGFQGVMRRWGFKGGSASHGNSLAHRTPGSTGQRQDPGKVFKGKKMPGRMGNDKIWMKSLTVFAIYPQKNMISVVGGVPGVKGGYIKVIDTWFYKWLTPPPFPTWKGPIPNVEVIRGQTPKNPYGPEAKIQSPENIRQVLVAQMDEIRKYQDEHMVKLAAVELGIDTNSNIPFLRNRKEVNEKVIEQGKQLLERAKAHEKELFKKTQEAKKEAGLISPEETTTPTRHPKQQQKKQK